jgi:hypothetical protein
MDMLSEALALEQWWDEEKAKDKPNQRKLWAIAKAINNMGKRSSR